MSIWSGGQIEVDFKGGPEIIAVPELLKAIQRGTFDVGYISPMYVGGEFPSFQIHNFGYNDNKRLAIRDEEYWQLVDKITRNHGMVGLGAWNSGLDTQIYLRKKPPTDAQGRVTSLKGIKIRTLGPYDSDVITRLGGTPVTMLYGEVYEGTRTGVIDGFITPVNGAIAFKAWEITSYVIPTPSLMNLNAMGFMNVDKFNSLPPETQKLIMEVAKEVRIGSYNYCAAITYDGFFSKAALGRMTTLRFTPEAEQTIADWRAGLLKVVAEGEPNLTSEIYRIAQKYFDPVSMDISTTASLER
jgi:TRAP-type C4-dicarboxylate transport system substrate-binding protein